MALSHWPRLWRTTSHLRWSQATYRLLRQLRSRLPKETAAHRPAPNIPELDPAAPDYAHRLNDISAPSLSTDHSCRRLVSTLQQGGLRLLNQTHLFDRRSPDWRLGDRSENRLWSVTLHYHAWLFELAQIILGEDPAAEQAEALLHSHLEDWLARCDLDRPGSEALAWNSYAIATRLGWWARLWHLLGTSYWQRHQHLRRDFLDSMWRQARHLHAHLEWDLRANHLLRDAVGLAWAGTFFQGREPDIWRKTSDQLASEQLHEQVFADGGHFERSVDYHLQVMNDWLALANLTRDSDLRRKLLGTWERMAEYALWLRHPDGGSVQFNDGAVREVERCLNDGMQLGLNANLSPRRGGRYFVDTGLVAWHGHPWTVFFDVGEIGPDYQPGHAHADSLTLECSWNLERLFIDPGTYHYDHDGRRQYDRSTAAHNTVCIDGQDSSEVWHIFRVGRRARPVDVRVAIGEDQLDAAGSHTGYDHLAGSPRHSRQIRTEFEDRLAIEDRVEGRGEHLVEGGWLLSPVWQATVDQDGWTVRSESQTLRVQVSGSSEISLSCQERPIHPDFGVEQTTTRLAWRYRGRLPLKLQTTIQSACGA